jgi:hypothetical protein
MTKWLAVLVALCLPAAVAAQDVDGGANMNLHITAPTYGGCGDFADFDNQNPNCGDLGSAAFGGAAFLWVVASHESGYTNGLGGVQFGISYSGVAVSGWALCTGGSEIPEGTWPDSGTGNACTWAQGCYNPTGEVAKVGYLAVGDGASGTVAITFDPRIDDAQYTDCSSTLISMCAPILADADLANGTSPFCTDECLIPIQESSWGMIKSIYTN